MTTQATKQFAAIYRTGGTSNFQWFRLGPSTRETAETHVVVIQRGGRRAFVADYAQSMALGLPDTFDAIR